jgi:two-component system, NarL family, sensor histidine kinase UhpB
LASDRHTWSEETYRIFGRDPKLPPAVFDEFQKYVTAESWARLRSAAELGRTQGIPWECDMELVRADGTHCGITVRGEAERDAGGSVVRLWGTVQDNTESKRSERELLRRSAELQGLAVRLADSEETERERLAQELHDQVGSTLTALSLNLTIIGRQLPPQTDEALRRRLDDSVALLDETLGFVRGVMTELRPPALDDYGIAPALRWYAEQFGLRTGLEVSVEAPVDSVRRTPDVEIAVFRIAQEALNNVMKHARARRVILSLEDTPDLLRLAIADDGRGCEAAKARDKEGGSPHWGHVMMRERAQSVGGRVRVDSARGQGTRVVVEVPG